MIFLVGFSASVQQADWRILLVCLLIGFVVFVIGNILFFGSLAGMHILDRANTFMVNLAGSQTRLNAILFVLCVAIALFGARLNAWETTFDSVASYFGLAPPIVQFNNVVFHDEFVGALGTFLYCFYITGIIKVRFIVAVIVYAVLVVVVNRDKEVLQQRWFPPFHYSI